MSEMQSVSLQLISRLLQYPDEELLYRLAELASIAVDKCPGEIKPIIQKFIEELSQTTLIQAQELYTAVFDMNPATTLNVTYHTYGDTEKRARVLSHLQRQYERAGWERIASELPDYLPMMLEFLSICAEAEHTKFVWQCLQNLGQLIDGLEMQAPTYASLLHPIARIAVGYGVLIENFESSFEEPM